MNKYLISFDKVLLEDNEVELNGQKLYEIFEELIAENCQLIYKDELDYGYTLLFKQLDKSKIEYLESIKDIVVNTKTELENYNSQQMEKSLKDLL